MGSIDGNTSAAEVRTARDNDPPRVARVEPVSATRIDVWFSETVNESSAETLTNWQVLEQGAANVPVLEGLPMGSCRS